MLQLALCDDSIDELSNMVNSSTYIEHQEILAANMPSFQTDLICFRLGKENGLIYYLDIIMPGFSGIDVPRDPQF